MSELENLPRGDDAFVQRKKEDLHQRLFIHQLNNNLKVVALYIYVATLSFAGCGKDTDMLVNAQGALFDMLKLCDDSHLMMQNLQSGASNILEKLKVGFLYLLDGLEDVAMDEIDSIKENIKSMHGSVKKTGESMKKTGDTVKEISRKAGKPKVYPPKTASEVLKWIDELEHLHRKSDGKGTGAESARYDDGSDKHRLVPSPKKGKSTSREKVLCLISIGVFVLSAVVCVAVALLVHAKGAKFAIIVVFGLIGLAAAVSLLMYCCGYNPFERCDGSAIPDAKSSNQNQEASTYSRSSRESELSSKVEGATWALALDVLDKSLPLIEQWGSVMEGLLPVVDGWYKECQDIVVPKFADSIKTAGELSTEEKLEYWKGSAFSGAVQDYYCRWRALQMYCEEGRQPLKKTRDLVEGYYTENLYPGQAIRRAWVVAEKGGILREERK